tara:strand:+ start:114236 stop:115873 length:1638 start_codon:yes stop_codon:yes gene_type:complete
MKIMKKIKNLLFIAVTLLLIFSSCREGTIEESPTSDTSALKGDSNVADLMQRAAMNDGSNDNIIDAANCFTIKFPYTVVIANITFFVNSEADLVNITSFLNFSSETNVGIIFPVTLVFNDYKEVVVNNQSELDSFKNTCNGENEADDDIECLDFSYPINVSVLNTLTERTTEVVLASDSELLLFINGLSKEEVVFLNFPLKVVIYDGTEAMINNLQELEDKLNDVKEACDEDDDFVFEDDNENTSSTGCDSPTPITAPFAYDGTGEFCWSTNDPVVYFNSIDAELVEVNGVNLTNQWTDKSLTSFPEMIEGSYYIRFVSTTATARFEAGTVLPVDDPFVCESPSQISLPFSFDGVGEFCWETTDDMIYLMSTEVDLLEVNGVDLTNEWSESTFTNFPEKVDGKYAIHYVSSSSTSHFEAGIEIPVITDPSDIDCDNCTVEETIDVLTGCADWEVIKLRLLILNLTFKYVDYDFNFRSDGTLAISKNGNTYFGDWSVSTSNSKTYVSIYVSLLSELNGSWEVKKINSNIIYLEFGISELRFESACN